MAYRYGNLSLIYASPQRTIWSYKTDDTLPQVLAAGYFTKAGMQRGDRIEVSCAGEAEATLAVLEPRKDKVRTVVLACHDPDDTLDIVPRKRPERKQAPAAEVQEEAAEA